jgi:hypothetical protein
MSNLARLLLPLLLLLAVAAWCGYWFLAERQVLAGFADWQAEQAAQGRELSYASSETHGFPLSLGLELRHVTLREAEGQSASFTRLAAEAPLWRLQDVAVVAEQFAGSTPARLQGLPQILDVTAAHSDGRLTFATDGRLVRADFEAAELRLLLPGRGAVTAASARAEVTPQAMPAADGPSLAVSAELDAIVLPQRPALPLDPKITRLSLDALIFGPLPARVSPQSLAIWSATGGRIEITALRLSWPPVEAEARGHLWLDQLLRPEAKMTVKLQGAPDLLARLVARGQMTQEQALPWSLALTGLTRRDDSSGAEYVELPLRVSEGLLRLGPLPPVPLDPGF